MNAEYYLPRLTELHIYDFDLYKCPIDRIFSSKLNVVFGTNGLGKTTLLNIIQYSIIGPYIGKVQFRNYKDQQKLKRPVYDKYYFRNRMNNISENAQAQVKFELGKDKYIVTHSLYEHKLISVNINGNDLVGDDLVYEKYERKFFGQNGEILENYLIDKYHRNIELSSGFPDIDSFILMVTETMFFSEERKFIFWDQDLCKLILSRHFMSEEKYFEYDEIQKLVKKYDSQARLTTYKMSMIKDFLGNQLEEKDSSNTSNYTVEDLQNIDNTIDSVQKSISNIEGKINSTEKLRLQNRIEFEEVSKKLINAENKWYKNIFPDAYQNMFNRYVPSIISGKCPFCGKEELNVKIDINECFYCHNKIITKDNCDLNELEIERKNYEIEKNRLTNNYQLYKTEISNLKNEKYKIEMDLSKLIDTQQDIKQNLDIKSNDNYAKYQQLEYEKQKLTLLYQEAVKKENQLALEIDQYMENVFQEYSKIFKKYAYSFLGNDMKIELELVGDNGDQLFQFYLNGTLRESFYELSESQRIFVDMAFRLSLLEFLHKGAYFISETPDSTLDFAYEENAVKTFSNFVEAGNTLFMSANARNSKLINSLVNHYKNEVQIINLLKISNMAGDYLLKDVEKLEIYDFLEAE